MRHLKARQFPLFMACIGLLVFWATPSNAAEPSETTLEKDIVRFSDQAEYKDALAAADKLVALRKTRYGAEDPRTGVAYGRVGRVKLETWDLPGAGIELRRAVNILEKSIGHDIEFATTLCDLGDLYKERGEFTRARTSYHRAIKVLIDAGKAKVSEVWTAQAKLAGLAMQAERFMPHQSENRLSSKDDSSLSLLNLSLYWHERLHDDRGILYDLRLRCQLYLKFQHAQECFQRAKTLAERLLGPQHPEHGRLLHAMARLATGTGQPEVGLSLFERAGDKLIDALGPDHPEVAELYNAWALANLNGKEDRFAQAIKLRETAEKIEERYLNHLLEGGTEAEKVAYVRFFEHGVDTSIAIYNKIIYREYYRGVDESTTRHGERLAVSSILRRKGRVLELMTENVAFLRENRSPEAQALLAALVQARQAVSRQVVAGPRDGDVERFEADLMRLQDEADAVELRVSAWVSKHRMQWREPVTLERVQAAIPKDAALFEYYKYSEFRRSYYFSGGDTSSPRDTGKYIAFFLRSTGRPVYCLSASEGSAEDVEKVASIYRKYAMDPNATKPASNVQYREIFDNLHRSEQTMKGVRHLLISPDGALNTVPMGVLPDPLDEKHLLIENYTITYLASGRDLLRPFSNAPNPKPALIVANPDYDAVGPGGPSKKPIDSSLLPVLSRLHFPSLEGTAEEAKMIARELDNARVHTESRASEAAMAAVHGPSVLHIATHGFFIDEKGRVGGGKNRAFVLDLENPSPAGSSSVKPPGKTGAIPDTTTEQLPLLSRVNPLHLSGLALAGADVRHGQTDDGILTAYEAATLDLKGTKLVVLSACETGIGEVASGEGVLGLRRAFFMAGAETQVMSLWQVDDAATSLLMGTYYRLLLREGLGRSEALRQAQLAIRSNPKMAHPFYWAAFISTGAWGPLEGPAFGAIPQSASIRFPLAVPPGGAPGCGCKVAGDPNQSPLAFSLGLAVYALSSIRRKKNAAR